MAIEIIIRGQVPQEKKVVYTIRCNHCNTLFRANEDDGSTNPDGNFAIACPVCNDQIFHYTHPVTEPLPTFREHWL